MKEMQTSETVIKPIEWFIICPQAREKLGTRESLIMLGNSLLAGQINPVLTKDDGQVISGARRIEAAKLVGKKELLARILKGPVSDLELNCYQCAENFHRLDLDQYERFKACEQIKNLNPNWSVKDLAGFVHLSPSAVTKLMSPAHCIPEWQDALREGKVTISDCYVAHRASESEQAALLVVALSGANRNALEKHAHRNKPSATPDGCRASRVSITISDGVKIIVSGKKLSMTRILEGLSEGLDAVKKGIKERLDVRTLERVQRDKWSLQGGVSDAV